MSEDLWGIPMENKGGKNPEPTLAERTMSHVPPPPSDVTVRTLASDLQSLKETGGNRPKPKSITLTLSAKDEDARQEAAAKKSSNQISPKSSRLKMLIVSAIGLLILIGLGIYALWRK